MKKPVNNPLRAAVIGLGVMGRNHARVYSEMEQVNLVALADPDADSLKSSLRRIPVNLYLDYREMLQTESLDLVSLAVPTRLHYALARDLIQQGINVLVEKPLASSQAEGNELINMARQKGVVLGVGHVERFNPVLTELKERLNSDLLGRVFQITIRRIGPFPERIKDVGVLLDLATHDIDILYFITGSEVENIWIESSRCLHENHEDLAVSAIRFNNGTIGVLIENWLSPIKIREIVVNGEKGMLVANLLTQDLYFYQNNYTSGSWQSLNVFRGMAEGDMTRFHIQRGEPLHLELEAFLEAVAGHKPFPVQGPEGLKALALVERLAGLAASTKPNPLL